MSLPSALLCLPFIACPFLGRFFIGAVKGSPFRFHPLLRFAPPCPLSVGTILVSLLGHNRTRAYTIPLFCDQAGSNGG
jgi:hypothetical protein